LTDKEKNKEIKKKRSLFHKIVNIFLSIGLGLFLIILLFLGISQTSTFREFLRKTVVEIANNNLNGTISIGKIDGTIFTSLILRNSVVNMGNDTLLRATTIELRTSPLQLLLKKIKVRKVEITDADISFISEYSGELNISRLIPPSKKTDTTKSVFPFKIEINNFSLSGINFNLQRYDFKGSKAFYDTLCMNDLRIRNLNLKLNALADIKNEDYELDLNELSLSPNINNFDLKKLSGQFAINKKELYTNNLVIETGNSNLLLKAKVEHNIFDSTAVLSKARLDLNLESDKFNFRDLSPFILSVGMLKEDIAMKVKIKGTMKDLNLDLIDIKFLNSHLQAKGLVKNIDHPKQMYISAAFKDTYINQSDVDKLLPESKLPVYEKLGLLRFDTLTFSGNPLNFKTTVALKTDKGKLLFDASLNFEKKPVKYDLNFQTIGFDISPFAGITSNLNCQGTINGAGFKPGELQAKASINADGSIINGNRIDTLEIDADAVNKIINYDLRIVSDTSSADLFGSLNFVSGNVPAYNLTGNFYKINLYKFVNDSSLVSNLNFSVSANGDGLDPDSIDLYLTFLVKNSTINGIFIDSTRAIADIRKDTGEGRVINLISDLADITVTGKFTNSGLASAISNEINLLTRESHDEVNKIMPSSNQIQFIKPVTPSILINKNASNLTKKNVTEPASLVSLKYLVEFKDFTLLSLFLGHAQIEVNGEMSGNLKNTRDSISFVYNTNIDYIRYRKNNDAFLLSNLNLDLSLANKHDNGQSGNIAAKLNLTTDRVFAGADLRDIRFNLDLNNKIAGLNFSAKYENSSVKLTGKTDISGNDIKLFLDTLNLDYNGFVLKNKQKAEIDYARNDISINNFTLIRNSGELSIKGTLSRNNNQDLVISLKDFNGKDLAVNFLQVSPESSPDARISMEAEIKGNFSSPLLNYSLSVDSVKYKDQNFGSFNGQSNYSNKNLSLNYQFTGPQFNPNGTALKISGNIPVDLAFTGVEKRLLNENPINIKLTADNFDLAPLSNILPSVQKVKGILTADLTLSGTPADLKPEGYVSLSNGSFVADANNLLYNADLKVVIKDENLTLENLVLKNSPDTKDGGTITGHGSAVIKNFKMVSNNFIINGELKVLGNESKAVSSAVYGDLVIATNGDVQFNMNEDGAFLKAPILIKKAILTFPPTQSAYRNTSDNFSYKYRTDTTAVRKRSVDFDGLVNYSQRGNASRNSTAVKKPGFDYSINITVSDEATIIFVLSKELNQNLTAVLKGNFLYERTNGIATAQGELTLLDGSTLEFIKTLQAEGTIRFENDLSNPNLNITATYRSYYYPADTTSTTIQEVAVAVKIKISGPLKELDKNFVKGTNNFAVYYGQDNIDNNVPDPTKDASDAAMFLVAGKFATDMTPQDKNAASNQFSSTATSMAGGILGGVLNKQLGDYVKNVELRRVGTVTKFNISGTLPWKLRYSIGGTTDVFQDLSQANVKFEYPLLNSLLLRFERKPPVTETTSTNEMINELGLKYKFEF
jgi:molybdopterin-binding protein